MQTEITLERVHAAMHRKQYTIFDSPKGFDVNIVGIRARERLTDRFDDRMTVSYIQRSTGEWAFHVWQCTTDSGNAMVRNPDHADGTAFLIPGQYRGSHTIRLHQGRYEAVCQKFGTKLPVYRTSTPPHEIDWTPSFRPFRNGTGINIHRANASRMSTEVGRWSAGCQVFADP